MASSSSKLRLKLVIDSRTKKVIFGEPRKDLVDFLFTILACNGAAGRGRNNSLKDLPIDHMHPNADRDMFLKPNMPVRSSSGNEALGSKVYASDRDRISKIIEVNFCYTDVMGTPASYAIRRWTAMRVFKDSKRRRRRRQQQRMSVVCVCSIRHSGDLSSPHWVRLGVDPLIIFLKSLAQLILRSLGSRLRLCLGLLPVC
ncbi:hypothetical protein ACLOJK_028105 [Asimina triloba]